MAKGGSKLLTGILSFLLGFLMALVIEVGVIVGAGYYVLNTDINNLFGLIKFSNVDGNGNQYVNTDTENGGVKNVMSLYNSLMDMYGRIGEVSLAEIEVLFPALDGLTAQLYDTLDDYVEISWSEFEATAFMDLPVYIQEKVMDIKPAALMRNLGLSGGLLDNAIVSALLQGVEADYVYVNSADKENSLKFPVYYDEYTKTGEDYYRTSPVGGVDAYPSTLSADSWITATDRTTESGKQIFRQYYYKTTVGEETVYVVTKLNGDGDYIYSDTVNDGNRYLFDYGENYEYITGNYYYDNDGKEVAVNPVTLRTLTEDAMAPLYSLPVTEIIGNDEMVKDLFGDVSVGELINGEVSFEEKVNGLRLASFVDVKATDPILLYMGYKVTGAAYDGASGTYSAVYASGTADETQVIVYVDANGVVRNVKDLNGVEIEGVTVGEVSQVVGGVTQALTIADMLDIEPDNIIMTYLAYGLCDVRVASGSAAYSHIASYEKTEGNMGKAYVYTKLSGGKTVIDYVTDESGNRLPCTTIDGIAEKVDDIRVTAIMRADVNDPIIAYVAYGLTDIVNDGSGYKGKVGGEDVIITVDSENLIVSVEKADGSGVVLGTPVSEISSRIDNITSDLALADIMDVEPTKFRADGTIEENNNIFTFIAFSVSEIQYSGGVYTGVYNVFDATGNLEHEYPCELKIITRGAKKCISHVVYDADGDGSYESMGVKVKIDGVPDQIERLTSVLRIKDIVEIDLNNKIMAKLGDYKIDEVGTALDELGLADAIEVSADNKIMMYVSYGLTSVNKLSETTPNAIFSAKNGTETIYVYTELVGETYKILGFYSDESCTIPPATTVSTTKINEVGAKLSRVTQDLTVGDVIDTRGDELLSAISGYKLGEISNAVNDIGLDLFIKDIKPDNAILMYVTYGVNKVSAAEAGQAYSYVGFINGIKCYIKTNESGFVSGVYSDAACTLNVKATAVNDVSGAISGLTQTLTVGEIIDISYDNTVLKLIQNSTIANLNDTVANVSIQRLYAAKIYETKPDGSGNAVVHEHRTSDFNANYLYYTDLECSSLAGANGKLTGIADGETYYTHGEVKGIWKILLEDRYGSEKNYKISEFGNVAESATANMQNATLGFLQKCGIIAASADLTKTLSGETLKDLTLSELIDIVINMDSQKP